MRWFGRNFSPRVMPKLGLGFDRLSAINPRIVMASLSAYGASGPWSDNPGIGGTCAVSACHFQNRDLSVVAHRSS